MERLLQQIRFFIEIDKLKTIVRQTLLIDKSRKENTAEHSWHAAVMAILLNEHAKDRCIDVFKVVKMLLIHDIIEIDAGDTFLYDEKETKTKKLRENKAADRIFNLLPLDQAEEFRSLWDEFEEKDTPEARFAASIDRLAPIIHNVNTSGGTWSEHGVTSRQVIAKTGNIENGSPILWEFARKLIDDSVSKGILTP